MKRNQYSESLEDYLETIFLLGASHVRSTDIANHLEISKASVNKAMNALIEKELATKEYYGDITLTNKGLNYAKKIAHKHELIKEFLVDVLHVSEDSANDEACAIEHILSEESTNKFEAFMEQLKKEKVS